MGLSDASIHIFSQNSTCRVTIEPDQSLCEDVRTGNTCTSEDAKILRL